MRKRSVGYDAVTGLQRFAVFALCWALACAAFAVNAQAETRTLKLFNAHTKERVSLTFKKNGRYLPDGLRDANRFLRDWRRNEMTKIDPELLDLVWEVYKQVGARDYIHVVSSYRSPATNNMLRKRSSGVAKNSQHTMGKAMDFFIPGVNLAKLRATGLRKEVGGVGYYPRSGSPFVHMDTGSVRHWPKMTRSQLAQVFPDGKTLHIPSDGKPMSGYKVALSEAKSGKSRSSRPTLVASAAPEPRSTGPSTTGQSLTNAGDVIRPTTATESQGSGNILASLFRSTDSGERTRVAAVRPSGEPVPPGALPGVRSSEQPEPVAVPDAAPSAFIENPPIPAAKAKALPTPTIEPTASDIVVASAAPGSKPDVFQPRTSVDPAPNTLDAQLQALARGETASSGPAPALAPESRLALAASIPSQKPTTALLAASRDAATTTASISGSVPIPQPSPVSDPVAAIAAATGTDAIGQLASASGSALAYASPTAVPAGLRAPAKPVRETIPAVASAPSKTSVSGRIPRSEIHDPLAGFAGLPDKSEPKLISSEGTTRHQLFAALRHPDQRSLDGFLAPSNRFVKGGFERFPYGTLRTDRFDGPAVVVLPVTFAR